MVNVLVAHLRMKLHNINALLKHCILIASRFSVLVPSFFMSTVMIQTFRTDRSGQTVQTQIRLLLEEQSDQGLHCLLFHLHLFDEIP